MRKFFLMKRVLLKTLAIAPTIPAGLFSYGSWAQWWRRYAVDVLLLTSLALLVTLFKFPVLHLPYFWDEPLTFVEPAHMLLKDGLWSILPGLGNPHGFYHHPPFFPFLLACFYKIFGESVMVARTFAMAMAMMTMVFTYLLGRRLLGRLTGVVAAVLLFFTPIFYAQSTMLMSDLPLTGFALGASYFFLEKRWFLFAFFAAGMALGRESGLAFSVAFILFAFCFYPRKDLRPQVIMCLALPIVLLFGYFISQKLFTFTRQAFQHEAYQHFDFTFEIFMLNSKKIFRWLFYDQGRWYAFAPTAAYFFYRLNKVEKGDAFKHSDLFLYLFVFIFFLLGLGFDRGLLFRYLNPLLPIFYLMVAFALVSVIRKNYLLCLALGSLLWQSNAFYYFPYQGPEAFDYNMEYTRVIYNHQAALGYLRAHYPNARVRTVWPLWPLLRYPYLGYVDVPIQAQEIAGAPYDILLWTSQADSAARAQLEKIIAEDKLVLAKEFETHFKLSRIYVQPGP